MTKWVYRCDEVTLTHPQMVELRNAGHLNLGIDNNVVEQIARIRGLNPNQSSASLPFIFWGLVSLGGLAYSIYLSFTSNWWWCIIGIIGFLIVGGANRRSYSESYLDVAMVDPTFYERVRAIGGWQYQIEESVVDNYRIDKNLLSPGQ